MKNRFRQIIYRNLTLILLILILFSPLLAQVQLSTPVEALPIGGQVLEGGDDFTGVGGTTYIGLTGGHLRNTGANSWATSVASSSGTLSNLRVYTDTPPGTGKSYTFKLYKNEVATALNITMSDNNTSAFDTSNSVSVTAGDRLYWVMNQTAAPAMGRFRYSSVFTPTIANNFIIPSLIQGYFKLGTYYFTPAPGVDVTSNESLVKVPVPTNGTLKNLYVYIWEEGGDSQASSLVYNYTIMKNSVATSLATSTAGTLTKNVVGGSDTIDSVSVSAGDFISLRTSYSGSPVGFHFPYLFWGLTFVPNNPGESVVFGGTDNTTMLTSVTAYTLPSGSSITAWDTNVSLRQQSTQDISYKNLYVYRANSPRVGNSTALTFMQNSNTTSLVANVTDNNNVASDTTHTVAFNLGDFISLKKVASGSPANTAATWSYVQFPSTSVPTVTTQNATTINVTTATLNGNITNTGNENPALRGFWYGNVSGGPYAGNWSESGSFGVGAFSYNATGLSAGTTYYFQSYAQNSQGASNGTELNFTTLTGLASVATNTATNLTTTKATLNGNITALNGAAQATGQGFVWAASSHGDPGNVAPSASAYASYWSQSGNYSIGTFTHNIDTQASNTTYYVRAAGQTAYGWAYGSELTFKTFNEVLWYQPNNIIQGNVLPDRDTGDGIQNGIITWGVNPPGLTGSVDGPYPINTPTPTPTYTPGPTTYPTTAVPTLTTPGGGSGIFFSPSPTPPFPGGALPGEIESSSGLPSIFWFVFPLIIILVIGIVIHDKTKSLAAQFGIMAICILFVALAHVWPLWMIIPFSFTGGACVLAGKIWSY